MSIFNTINFITSNFKVYNHNDGTGEYELNCPSCGNDKKFFFNVKKGKGQCWKCGFAAGSLKTLFNKMKQLGLAVNGQIEENPDEEEYRYKVPQSEMPTEEEIQEEDGLENYLRGALTTNKPNPILSRVPLPEYYRPLPAPPSSHLGQQAFHWLTCARGLTEEQIMKYEIGFCSKGEHAGKIIIPVRDEHGEQVYWVGRRFTGAARMKKRFHNPTRKNEGKKIYHSKKTVLFNIDRLIKEKVKTVVLVEGWRDVFSLDSRAMALLGKTLSKEQLELMTKYFSSFIILLDPDTYEDGYDMKIATELYQYTQQVWIVRLPPGVGDAGDLSSKVLTYWIKRLAVRFSQDMLVVGHSYKCS